MRAEGLCPAALAAALSVACVGGTETGNPPFDAKLSYTAYSSQPESVGVGQPGRTLAVSAAWLTLGDVSFLMSGTCGAGSAAALRANGIGVGNHAAAASKSERISMIAGDYCEVDLPFTVAPATLPAGAPPELSGNSIMLEGTLADGTRFSILSASGPVVRLTPTASDVTMQKSEPDVLVAFDAAVWLDGLDFAGAPAKDGVIQIGPDTNAPLLTDFEARLPAGVKLFRDVDGDGRVDPGSIPIAAGK